MDNIYKERPKSMISDYALKDDPERQSYTNCGKYSYHKDLLNTESCHTDNYIDTIEYHPHSGFTRTEKRKAQTYNDLSKQMNKSSFRPFDHTDIDNVQILNITKSNLENPKKLNDSLYFLQ